MLNQRVSNMPNQTLVNEVTIDRIKFTVKPAKLETEIYRAAIRRLLAILTSDQRASLANEVNVLPWVKSN
jgi:hypothetical protein